MYIGNFNRLIRIETPQETKNTFGEVAISWVEYTTVHAEKFERPARGEKFEANQKVYIESVTYSIYFEEGITSKMQLIDLDENRTYSIQAIKEIGYKEGLQIICEYKDNL